MTKRALILVDIQNDYFTGPLHIQYPSPEESVKIIAQAIDKAEAAGIPVALIRHNLPEGAPIFSEGSTGWEFRQELESRRTDYWKYSEKVVSSSLQDAELLSWLKEKQVDTLTLVGYMTNNCILGTAFDAENLGFTTEVLSDATGAISMKNSAGEIDAKNLHEALLVVLQSNLAAVTDFQTWSEAIDSGTELDRSNLVETAMAGATMFGK